MRKTKKETMHNKNYGRWGENLATDFLINKGFKILERNYCSRGGEIDIVASKGGTIHFIEVKARTSAAYGYPLEAITKKKLKHIENTALSYMSEAGILLEKPMCIDAISIVGEEITFIEGIYL